MGGSALPSGRPATTGRPATALGARVLTPAASKVANSTAPAHTQALSPTTGSALFLRVCPAPVPSTFRGCHTGRRHPTPRCCWDVCRRSRTARCASASARSGTRTIQCRTKVRNSGSKRCFLATLRQTKPRDGLHWCSILYSLQKWDLSPGSEGVYIYIRQVSRTSKPRVTPDATLVPLRLTQ